LKKINEINSSCKKRFIDYDNYRNEERTNSSLIKIGKDLKSDNEWICYDPNHKISDKYREICPSRFPKKTN